MVMDKVVELTVVPLLVDKDIITDYKAVQEIHVILLEVLLTLVDLAVAAEVSYLVLAVAVDILEDVQQDSGLLTAPMVVEEDHITQQLLITLLLLVETLEVLVVMQVADIV